MTVGICPSCSGRETSKLTAAQDFARGHAAGFELHRCTRCGLIRTEPELAESELELYYPEAFYGADSPAANWAMRIFLARRIARLKRVGVRTGRVLDVGCGAGMFVAALQAAGYDAVGVETSKAGRDRAASRGLSVYDDLDSVPDGAFHAVTLWQVLEHVREPLPSLQRIHDILAPGGVLVVAVPNAASWEVDLVGTSWFHLDVPRHQLHFDKTTLTELLQRANLKVVKRSFMSLEYNPFGLIQSVANLAGLEHNALYQLLKHGRRLSTFDPTTQLLLVLTLLTAPFLVAGAIAYDCVAAAFAASGTMTFVARRQD